jgi:hypothetical protein
MESELTLPLIPNFASEVSRGRANFGIGTPGQLQHGCVVLPAIHISCCPADNDIDAKREQDDAIVACSIALSLPGISTSRAIYRSQDRRVRMRPTARGISATEVNNVQ